MPHLEVYLPGPLPFELYRRYRPTAAERDVGLGGGWIHSLAWSLEVMRRGVVVWTGDGRRIELPNPEIG